MIRPLILSVVLPLMFVACKPSGLQTIEEGEAYAKDHGVVLTDKKEVSGVVVAPRVYDFSANGKVQFRIMQFNTEEAGASWKKIMDESPIAPETRIQKGVVMFMISTLDASDADRQKVINALK